ncbi:MAG: hypothetical protein U9Q82_11440 [Chloroflexota bacterium]|nr:hypothetical protein [Chloroflexota bacterium]
MKKRKTISLSLLGVLLITIAVFNTVQAAKTPKHVLTIVNKTKGDIIFVIKDEYELSETPDKYVKQPHLLNDEEDAVAAKITLEDGESDDIELDEDTYWVFYVVCGDFKDSAIKLEDDFKLVVYPCENRPTKMRINNHLSEAVAVAFTGYDDYEFDIELGKNKVELFSGNYDYTYEACDTEMFGEIFITKDGTTELTLHGCEWYTSLVREYGGLQPVKYRIINHASFPLILTLIGPENYLVTANAGVNRVDLIAGSYTFSYYMDYQMHSGTMFVPKHGNGALILRPGYVMDNGLNEAE